MLYATCVLYLLYDFIIIIKFIRLLKLWMPNFCYNEKLFKRLVLGNKNRCEDRISFENLIFILHKDDHGTVDHGVDPYFNNGWEKNQDFSTRLI